MAITYQQSGINYHLMDAFKNACIKAVTESKVIKDILTSLKMTTAPPSIAQAAFRPEQGEIVYDYAAQVSN